METFITKEAEEKAKEIKLKAEEEYAIEKSSIVRSEIAAIDKLYEQKFKKATLDQQIAHSTITNKTRLRILSTREEILEDIFAEAQEQLKKISQNAESYKPVLEGLIEEGILSLLEHQVTVRVRECDVELAKEASIKAAEQFKEQAKFDVKIIIDESKFLNKDIAGGVVVVNSTGKIEVNNTLEERLKLLNKESLPAIRFELFGPSVSRKFFD